MLFTLKKILGGLLLPLPFLLLIIGLSLILLWLNRWTKSAKVLLSLSWLSLLLLSLQPVADRLLAPLEQDYPTYNLSSSAEPNPIKAIVVLGGGYTYNPTWAPSSNLIGNSLPRVTEGVRQYLAHPNAKLIFTGGHAQGNPMSSAETASLVAQSLGVAKTDIITLVDVYDTEQEAKAVAQLVGKAPFLLVTSANHLPRAMTLFQQQGLSPFAAPANQLAIQSPLNWWEKLYPSALYLSHSERVWYEKLGQWQQKAKSWFSTTDNDPNNPQQP